MSLLEIARVVTGWAALAAALAGQGCQQRASSNPEADVAPAPSAQPLPANEVEAPRPPAPTAFPLDLISVTGTMQQLVGLARVSGLSVEDHGQVLHDDGRLTVDAYSTPDGTDALVKQLKGLGLEVRVRTAAEREANMQPLPADGGGKR